MNFSYKMSQNHLSARTSLTHGLLSIICLVCLSLQWACDDGVSVDETSQAGMEQEEDRGRPSYFFDQDVEDEDMMPEGGQEADMDMPDMNTPAMLCQMCESDDDCGDACKI